MKPFQTTIYLTVTVFAFFLCVLLNCSCGGRSYEEGVQSRLKRVLDVESLPANIVIGATTLDYPDDWVTYQIELTMPEEELKAFLKVHEYDHITFTEPTTPYEQLIKIDKPFHAIGVYRRKIENSGVCEIFYEGQPGRYFVLYMQRP